MKVRKPLIRSLLLALSGGLSETAGANPPAPSNQTPSQTLFPAGEQPSFKGPAAYFTGDAQVQMLFPANETAAYSGASVHFQAGARTAWHTHPAGQHIVVTEGVALTGTRDGRVIRFHPGDAVWCPAGVDHWHGATQQQAMTHLVITGSNDGQNVVWKEQVSDEIYLDSQRSPAATRDQEHR